MLWLDALKSGREPEIEPPGWVDVIALSSKSGISVPDLLEMDPLWVTRVSEYYYQVKMQQFDPFRVGR